VLWLLAPQVLALLAAGFPDQRQQLAVLMVQLMAPAIVLQGLSGVSLAVLYARNRFALPAFAAASFNAGIILGSLALHAVLGVTALVIGVLLGAFVQVALQAYGLVRLGFRYRPALDLQLPEVRTAVRLYGPVAAGMLVTVAGIVIDRNLASRLDEGSLSVMRYATTLVQFPLGLVGVAASLAVLPTLSRHASAFAAGNPAELEAYRSTLAFGVRLVLLLMLPATIGLMVLSQPVVELLFERGEFTPFDTFRTSLVFLAYAPQMPLTALDQLLIVACYARKDTRTPVLVGVGTVLLYLVSALLLIGPLRVVGLAAANSVQNGAHGVVLFLLLQRAIGGLAGRVLWVHLLKVAAASTAMGVALAVALLVYGGLDGLAAKLAFLALVTAVGTLGYFAMADALRVPEVRVLRELVLARIGLAGR
jgi:putative peptidoglycan lipid II flippase